MKNKMIAFGPVPSRRLGKSIGINNIPPKICTYSCVYCQIGKTLNMSVNRQEFYSIKEIVNNVEKQVEKAQERGEHIDYLTFVSDGEPTLDCNIGKEIEQLKLVGFKIAVITNSTLLSREDVQEDLLKADLVSVKIDAISQDIWRKINRPHKKLQLDRILEGVQKFSNIYNGVLITETMIIHTLNDKQEEYDKVACYISKLPSHKSYLSIPTRPPAYKRIRPATENSINMAFQMFSRREINVEYLLGYEGNKFAYTGNAADDILSITSVHPMREEGINELLKKAHEDRSVIEQLIQERKLIKVNYHGNNFYLRKLQNSF